MFLTGRINENLEPVIENLFLVGREKPVRLNAILDTGFNGMLCLPRRFHPDVELSVLGLETFELADGTCHQEVLYLGQILLGVVPHFAEMMFTDSDQALIGMQMLLDKVAVFDLRTMRIDVE